MTLSTEDLHKIIKQHLKSDDFEFISYEYSHLQNKSIGFLSNQDKKCITYKVQDEIEELYIFVKELPYSDTHREITIQMGAFQRESLVLEEILANFQDYSIPIPKCLLTKPDGTIVLNDISMEGYQNKDLYETLDLVHCKKVLKSLSKIHGASFIMESREEIKLNEKYPIIETEVLLNADPEHPGCKCFGVGLNAIKEIAQEFLPDYPAEVTDMAFDYMEQVLDKLKPSQVHTNALSHSDMWGNNIMYKYDNGNLEEACIIDFQLTTYKPPAFDVLFFLHNCTARDLRTSYDTYLSKYYFSALSKQLAQSNINIDDIMSWTDFEEQKKEYLPIVLATVPMYLSFILMPVHVINDVMNNDTEFCRYFLEDRTEYAIQAMNESTFYRERVLESLMELFDYFKEN
ncbi:uncharacterized protein [Halyomorpha halys]|uniref:uncharacterized protein n=1 Tax=Halyomorpha halys TaxID=286706 RepID=UPI0006D4F386|nr:uncharacterized protein LOC106688956 [Halyomorpha halys]KAE8573137.1 EcKinase 13 [Halyomorpha halys]